MRDGSRREPGAADPREWDEVVRQLEVDWNALHSAFQMNMPEVKCFFAVADGSVLKLPPGDQALPAVRAAPDHFVPVEAVPSRIQYQWLDSFIKTIEDEALRKRMEAAINGKGAFRRFKDILLTKPDERRRWFEFRDVQMRQRIVEWVREQGVEATNVPDWSAEHSQAPPPRNHPRDIEALRDLLIDWADGRDPAASLEPLVLEELAQIIGEAFRLKPLS
jgi:hypothetical protein